jgi:hypothetical protein
MPEVRSSKRREETNYGIPSSAAAIRPWQATASALLTHGSISAEARRPLIVSALDVFLFVICSSATKLLPRLPERVARNNGRPHLPSRRRIAKTVGFGVSRWTGTGKTLTKLRPMAIRLVQLIIDRNLKKRSEPDSDVSRADSLSSSLFFPD